VCYFSGVGRRVVKVDSYYYICSRTKMCEVECTNIKKEPVSYVHVHNNNNNKRQFIRRSNMARVTSRAFMLQILL